MESEAIFEGPARITLTMDTLSEHFTSSASRYSSDNSLVESLHNEIISRHSVSGRYYHTLTHLDYLIKALLPMKERFTNWDAIVFATAYHDIVYNPIRKDNEERSSAFAAKALSKLGVDELLIKRCQELILATKTHTASDDETNFFTDADLGILGAKPSAYDEYANNVRKEYRMIPDILYNPGRKKVLQHFLGMDSIFKTSEFREQFEDQARKNILRELETY